MMIPQSFLALINNASLLIAIGFAYIFYSVTVKHQKPLWKEIVSGIVLGLMGIIVILNAYKLRPGLVFDTRSILMCLSGMFLGSIPTLIATAIISIYRLFMGGIGAPMGAMVTISSGLIGIMWRKFRAADVTHVSPTQLYLLGLAVHLNMLVWAFTMPLTVALQTINKIAFPVLLIYPAGTTLLGLIFTTQFKRINSEQELADSREKFRIITENAADAIWIYNVKKQIPTYFSPSIYELLGYTPGEIVQKGFMDSQISPSFQEFIDYIPERIRACHKGDDQSRHETREIEQIHKDGSRIQTEVVSTLLYNSTGEIEELLGITRNVSERNKLTNQLHESNERFLYFMQYIPGVAFIKDEDLKYVFVNQAFANSVGCSVEYPLGKKSEEIYSHKIAAWINETEMKIMRDGIATVIESEGAGLDLGKVYLVVRFAIPRGDKPAYLGGIAIDVTDKKRAEDELRKMNSELEQRVQERTKQLVEANVEMEAFSYSVSHDLRSPLRSIEGLATAILEDFPSLFDAEARLLLDRIQFNTRKMNALMDDLLRLSKISRADLRLQAVNLSELTASILSDLQQQQPGINVQQTIQPGIVAVADKGLISIVLYNLLHNALKFSAKKSIAELDFRTCIVNGSTTYCIKDNGIGFDMAHANQMFEVFSRLNSAQEYPGTGIGLVIVKRIIQKHGGDIWAEGLLNEGASIYFTLPTG
jgi:PAS domain S-box-containing protein